jgi:transcriptional regulator with XRE-family HTH domain
MRIGEALKKARESKGLTQKQLADMLYVDPSLVCRWEKGQRRIMADDLITILEILGICIDEFKKMC